jgi:hypothetical protein
VVPTGASFFSLHLRSSHSTQKLPPSLPKRKIVLSPAPKASEVAPQASSVTAPVEASAIRVEGTVLVACLGELVVLNLSRSEPGDWARATSKGKDFYLKLVDQDRFTCPLTSSSPYTDSSPRFACSFSIECEQIRDPARRRLPPIALLVVEDARVG